MADLVASFGEAWRGLSPTRHRAQLGVALIVRPVARRQISRVYLVEAVLEAGLIAAWR